MNQLICLYYNLKNSCNIYYFFHYLIPLLFSNSLFVLIFNEDKKKYSDSASQPTSLALRSSQKATTMNNSTEDQLHSSSTGCPAMVSMMFTSIMAVISTATFIGNVLVATAFIKTPTLRTSTNYYIVNMAVSDLLAQLISWPLYVSEGMLTPNIFINEPWASSVCKLGMYVRAVSQLVSVLCLVLISLDRFVAIVFPLKTVMMNVKVRVTFLSIPWIIPICCGLPYVLFARINKEKNQTICRFRMSDKALEVFYGGGFILFYVFPVSTIIVLYSLIIRALKNRPNLQKGKENVKRCQQNQTVVKILISIVFAFFICWTPLCIYLLLKKFHPSLFAKDKCLLFIHFSFYVFPSLSTAINPVILFVFSTNYNQALKSLCSHVFSVCKCKFKVSRP